MSSSTAISSIDHRTPTQTVTHHFRGSGVSQPDSPTGRQIVDDASCTLSSCGIPSAVANHPVAQGHPSMQPVRAPCGSAPCGSPWGGRRDATRCPPLPSRSDFALDHPGGLSRRRGCGPADHDLLAGIQQVGVNADRLCILVPGSVVTCCGMRRCVCGTVRARRIAVADGSLLTITSEPGG
jgi:hypothetical protein